MNLAKTTGLPIRASRQNHISRLAQQVKNSMPEAFKRKLRHDKDDTEPKINFQPVRNFVLMVPNI